MKDDPADVELHQAPPESLANSNFAEVYSGFEEG